jgi:hypothetical protein
MIKQGDFIIERASPIKKINAYLGKNKINGEIRIYKILVQSFRFDAPLRNTVFTDEDYMIINVLVSEGRIRHSEEEIILKKDFLNFTIEVLDDVRENEMKSQKQHPYRSVVFSP